MEKYDDQFLRDSTGALINNNISKFDRYKMQREKAIRQNELSKKVDRLEQDMTDIKELLQQIHSRIK